MNANDLSDEIYKVEGFTVWIADSEELFKDYYKHQFMDDATVSDWKKRFKKKYKGASVVVLKGNGTFARGNMLLRNLRYSYSLESLREEIETLNNRLDYELQKNNPDINDDDPDPYEVLGVDKDSDFAEIKETYKRKCKEFHPDTLNKYNLHKDFEDFATRKMQEINVAYGKLKPKTVKQPV